jgi:CheY-like chemotaxis protein
LQYRSNIALKVLLGFQGLSNFEKTKEVVMDSGTLKHKTAQPQVNPSWIGKTVLVVEDIELNFRYIKELLTPTNINILRAENGKVAVELVEKEKAIDIVLMDIFMPIMNGYEATRRIKVQRSDLPIIAQTAYALSEERNLAMEAGCDDFIAKPIEKENLINKMDHFFHLQKNEKVM